VSSPAFGSLLTTAAAPLPGAALGMASPVRVYDAWIRGHQWAGAAKDLVARKLLMNTEHAVLGSATVWKAHQLFEIGCGTRIFLDDHHNGVP
jgi:hypothetical protein